MDSFGIPSGVTDGGQHFNYAVWTPGTRVTLHSVPWTSDYRDIVDWQSQLDLDTYLFEDWGKVETRVTNYVRMNTPVRLDIPFNDAMMFNYMRVENPAQPIGENSPRVYYYFIQDVVHVAPSTTQFVIMLDVWSSFKWGVSFGPAYVERSHFLMHSDYGFMSNVRRNYLTQPEGLDIGNEYGVMMISNHEIARAETVEYLIHSNTLLEGDYGTVDNPHMNMADGSPLEGLPNAASTYWFKDKESLSVVLKALSKFPWISQGIICIQAIPPGMFSGGGNGVQGTGTADGVSYVIPLTKITTNNKPFSFVWSMGSPRDKLSTQHMSHDYGYMWKLYTYPYTVYELTTWTGAPLVLKPECMPDNVEIGMLAHLALPAPRLSIYPKNYNLPATQQYTPTAASQSHSAMAGVDSDDGGEFLDMTTGITNMPQFSTLNNGYLSYMSSSAHTIAYQHSSADWSQQKALTGNQLGYDQASRSMQLNSQLTDIQNSSANRAQHIQNVAGWEHTGVNALGSVTQGAISGASMGPEGMAAGAVMGVFNGVLSAGNQAITNSTGNKMTALGNQTRSQSTDASNAASAYMRDTNKSYADFAARGDYQNAIAGIQARVQDAKMIQPTTSGQVGGDAFLLGAYKWEVSLRVKQITGAALHSVVYYWMRYGYAVNRWANLGGVHGISPMNKFTYWQVKELYVMGNRMCPESYRQTIRGIFEKGVTVWRSPHDIGTPDMYIQNYVVNKVDCIEMEGIGY